MSNPVLSVSRVDGIACLTFDNPPVNTIDARVREALDHALDELEQNLSRRGFDSAENLSGRGFPRAVVVTCAGSTFFSGADINEFSGPPMEHEYRRVFNRLEALSVPVVAAMHGTVMGGGLEIALACHYRIALPGTRFAFPEVTLGIFPGAGGTQRMPRLIGVEKTLDMVLSARPVDTAKALELGFLDAVVEGRPDTIGDLAVAFANDLLAQGKGARPTSGMAVDASTATPEILERARARARKEYPHRQAGLAAVDVIGASATLPLQEGLEYETSRVNECKDLVESKASIHVFFAERATRKIPGLPADAESRPVKAAGIIGSGTMGGGISICFANAGIPVTLIDADAAALERGLANLDRTYESMVKRGRLSPDDKARRLALIRGSLDYADLATADVIIEAVFEDLALKQRIFTGIDRVAKPGAVLATNTSSLDIGAIAAVTTRPGDVIGMHFFSPANVMPLLEVVKTDTTSASTVRTAMDLAKPLRKTPVLAKVCYGFIGNRMMEGYAREAERIVLEGATPRQVDAALESWGMAMGILAVFDMAGIDVGVKVHAANPGEYPSDPAYYAPDKALHAAGRLGQKTGKGYYRYVPGDRTRHDDPEALEIIRRTAQELGIEQRTHTDEEIIARCLYPLLNEGIRILEEGVALRPADVDVVWTSGYGFPRWRGGPMFYADTIGLKALRDGILAFREQFGPMHWEPAALLTTLVEQGKTLSQWHAERNGGVR